MSEGITAMVSAVSLAAGLYAAADPPQDEIDRSESAIALANPQISSDLLNALPESILDNSDIWVDPSLPADTPFLLVDDAGELIVAPGQSDTQERAAAEALEGADGEIAPLAACSTSFVIPATIKNRDRPLTSRKFAAEHGMTAH